MSPITTLSLLAFASAVLAVPSAHHQHQHLHHAARAPQGTYGESAPPAYSPSSSPPPYPLPSGSHGPSGYAWGSSGGGAWGTGYPKPTGGSPVSPEEATCTSPSTKIWRSKATSTSVSTIYVSPSPAPAGWTGSAVENAVCTPDTTITEKVTQTVTVTAGQAAGGWGGSPAAPAAAPPSSPAAPAYSAPASPAAPAYSASPSSPAAPANTWAAQGAPSPAPAQEAQKAPAAASGAAPQSSSGSLLGQATGALPNVSSIAGAFTGGKKGLAYNDASLVTPFVGAPGVGFAYNWVSNSGGLPSGIPYIPELHDMSSTFTSTWASDAQQAIDNGAEYLFSFNEPDIPSQANLSPQAAAAGWMQYMEPFAGKVKMCAPAVSNSQTPGQGLSWLSEFMSACSTCTIACVNQHWYDSVSNDIGSFQQQIGQAASQSGLPVFVGEFGFIGSDSDISSALSQVMGWMDGNNDVIGYAYYFLSSGFLLDGTSPSSYGAAYLA